VFSVWLLDKADHAAHAQRPSSAAEVLQEAAVAPSGEGETFSPGGWAPPSGGKPKKVLGNPAKVCCADAYASATGSAPNVG
jgi:hypothetical protein